MVSMAQQDFESIFLLFADLRISRDHGLTSVTGADDPISKAWFSPFPTFQHWAIQVRETCYEVTSKDYYAVPGKIDNYVMNVSHIKDWETRRETHNLKFEKIKIGVTRFSDEKIRTEADFIWENRFNLSYKLDEQNCQNFASLLHRKIQVDSKDSQISKRERSTWRRVPNRVTQYKTFAKKFGPSLVTVGVLDACSGMPMAHALGATALVAIHANPVVAGVVAVTVVAAVTAPIVITKGKDRKWWKEIKKDERRLEAERRKTNSNPGI